MRIPQLATMRSYLLAILVVLVLEAKETHAQVWFNRYNYIFFRCRKETCDFRIDLYNANTQVQYHEWYRDVQGTQYIEPLNIPAHSQVGFLNSEDVLELKTFFCDGKMHEMVFSQARVGYKCNIYSA